MTAPGLRERKKAKTRRALQDSALRLIAEQGYEATTVEQIAAAADVSPSTFFRYFPTKEDAVLQDEYDPMLLAAIQHQRADLAPLDATRAALRETFRAIDAADRDKVYQRVQLALGVPAVRARMMDGMDAAERLFAEGLAERLGRDADDFDIAVTVAAMTAAMTAALRRWAAGGGTDDLAETVDHALAVLQHGLQA
ncbi:acyl-CoA-like ligand-binding transcription factor [Nakamurella lactea]|uniref:acyl-CoA-like ligand-binding transcription factor n=1 Tax=Nakamurella lactea TaxID=459515 RepID=UPI0004015161|nr:TetR family transcriptional regulator [Nakamurella lactea]